MYIEGLLTNQFNNNKNWVCRLAKVNLSKKLLDKKYWHIWYNIIFKSRITWL